MFSETQAIRLELSDSFSWRRWKCHAIMIVFKNILASVIPCGDVVEDIGKLDSVRVIDNEQNIAYLMATFSIARLTP